MSTHSDGIGQPLSRIDGPMKVTGRADYAADYSADALVHGVIVGSRIASGRVTAIDASAALAFPGVIAVMTHENRPRIATSHLRYKDTVSPPGKPYRPLYDDRVRFADQPVALVLASSYEAARDAADLVRVTYAEAAFETDLTRAQAHRFEPTIPRFGIKSTPKPRGDAVKALAAAEVKVDATFETSPLYHNPIELFATTAIWEPNGRLLVYDKNQGSQNAKLYLRLALGLKPTSITVINAFVGGAFGIALRPSHCVLLAAMAAKQLARPVRVTLTRAQMFGVTFRPHAIQHVSLGCDRTGRLTAIRHDAVAATSTYENQQEALVTWSGMAYACENVQLRYEIAKLDTPTPGDMRAPGAATGVFALECAMDELATRAGIDPVVLRTTNFVAYDQNDGKAMTSNAQRDCYAQAAERFGWAHRPSEPRSMRDGRELVGWGMAGGVWDARMAPMPTRARVAWRTDGRLEVSAGASDIGTGTYTILAQIAAEAFDIPARRIEVRLGDSRLPLNPVEGGSWMAASTGAAVARACEKLQQAIVKAAKQRGLLAKNAGAVRFTDGRLVSPAVPGGIAIDDIVSGVGHEIDVIATASPPLIRGLKEVSYSHSAVFAEVRVDEELGVTRVTRVVTAIAAGRILNPKTARSQILGGVVMGIGMALHEEGAFDHRFGRITNHSLADYHVPTNADIHDIDVIFVDERDERASPLGVKGLGEIGIVAVVPAIVNAIYHATGRRIRALPVTPDKLMGAGDDSDGIAMLR